MKFKLDENLDPRLAALFIQAGYEADSVLAEALSGGADDAIFQVCQQDGRCLVTLDLDFSNPFRFPPERTPGIIVLRPARPVMPLIKITVLNLLAVLTRLNVQGKLWIVEPGRIREYNPDSPPNENDPPALP